MIYLYGNLSIAGASTTSPHPIQLGYPMNYSFCYPLSIYQEITNIIGFSGY